MNLHIVFRRDGAIVGMSLMPDEAQRLMFTPAARDYLVKDFRQRGAICANCGIIARSTELIDGVCKYGTGCRCDVDEPLTKLPTEQRAVAMQTLADQLFAAFFARVEPAEERKYRAPRLNGETDLEQGGW